MCAEARAASTACRTAASTGAAPTVRQKSLKPSPLKSCQAWSSRPTPAAGRRSWCRSLRPSRACSSCAGPRRRCRPRGSSPRDRRGRCPPRSGRARSRDPGAPEDSVPLEAGALRRTACRSARRARGRSRRVPSALTSTQARPSDRPRVDRGREAGPEAVGGQRGADRLVGGHAAEVGLAVAGRVGERGAVDVAPFERLPRGLEREARPVRRASTGSAGWTGCRRGGSSRRRRCRPRRPTCAARDTRRPAPGSRRCRRTRGRSRACTAAPRRPSGGSSRPCRRRCSRPRRRLCPTRAERRSRCRCPAPERRARR